jgi:biopolymer transport protein ExbB
MFALGMNVWVKLQRKPLMRVPERKWRRWIDHSHERKGELGDLLNRALGRKSIKETVVAFEELRSTEIAPFERDLKVMKICVSAAPLLGLLGTVTGMLATFGALAEGSGGEKTMGLVAEGISEALITTMTGLVIALPGLLFHYQMARKHERYRAFLTHLETACTQYVYRHRRRLKVSTMPRKPRPDRPSRRPVEIVPGQYAPAEAQINEEAVCDVYAK